MKVRNTSLCSDQHVRMKGKSARKGRNSARPRGAASYVTEHVAAAPALRRGVVGRATSLTPSTARELRPPACPQSPCNRIESQRQPPRLCTILRSQNAATAQAEVVELVSLIAREKQQRVPATLETICRTLCPTYAP
jgi:hypothetical protein